MDVQLPDLTWCKRRFGSSDLSAALAMGWMAFVEVIKNGCGSACLNDEKPPSDPRDWPLPEALGVEYDQEEGVPPGQIMEALGTIVERAKLIHRLKAGEIIFRARVHPNDEQPTSAAELGPPPPELATQPNRMSPAGTVMFYGAFDRDTAVLETFDCARHGEMTVSVAQFKSNKTLTVLDLTGLPEPPSFFGDYEMHHGIRFLWDFERDFTKPITRDGREHIEYLPTQVVTDFFRNRFRAGRARPINGIVYRSSREGGRLACVLFFDAGSCGNAKDSQLQLLDSRTDRISGSVLIERFC